jgi:hypothetical protein
MPEQLTQIRILESEPNRKGDLFGRLMEDLFAALGYERFRLNIHKSGREIDLEGDHRVESRRLIAECKATEDPIGGDELNKFYGAVDVEKRKLPGKEVSAYFISLSGFRETAIEQERDAGSSRFICLDGARVAQELVAGRIIVSEANAMELAGRCAAGCDQQLKVETPPELLAHELGWIWVVYFQTKKERNCFTLIHADGGALSSKLARHIIEADKSINGALHTLSYLPPLHDPAVDERKLEQAERAYLEYVGRECGEIELQGLPADQEVGSRRLRLENIFVPLHLVPVGADRPEGFEQGSSLKSKRRQATSTDEAQQRQSVGKVLTRACRFVVLGLPGGGKSTLLKRIATAYAFPERRSLIHDDLPDRKWMPLFVRCRQLEGLVRSPITEILAELSQRAEIPTEYKNAFGTSVTRCLQSGLALLLVDGLDEISEEGDRIAFVRQLRTFLATYPAIAVVITCREAGFRVIGGALAGQCEQYKLADLNDAEIRSLTVSWHKEVVGNKREIIEDAQRLAETICRTDRVRHLAQNPLLLTTLLLVRRWVGQLPTKRSVLYGKAVEVLLMTWNVEGHESIDPEEALPQLEFVAFAMMKDGAQQISLRRLREYLGQARAQMPEILGYTKVGIPDFIKNVELRSSVLIQSGDELEDGTLYPTYEFRHLTFQEYLAARAVVEGHYSSHGDSDTMLTVLRPHLGDENWEEVVLLCAVLGGRKSTPLIEFLINEAKAPSLDSKREGSDEMSAPALLGKCIADEVQLGPEVLREAMRWVARRRESPSGLFSSIFRSKYGSVLVDVCMNEMETAESDLIQIGGGIAEIMIVVVGWGGTEFVADRVDDLLVEHDPRKAMTGCLAAMGIAWSVYARGGRPPEMSADLSAAMHRWIEKTLALIRSKERYLAFSAMWALAWLFKSTNWAPDSHPQVFDNLLAAWRTWQIAELHYVAAWALTALPLVDRSSSPFVQTADLVSFASSHFEQKLADTPRERMWGETEKRAALVLGYYARAPWSDEQLVDYIPTVFRLPGDRLGIEMLQGLGRLGVAKLAEISRRASPPTP